MYATIFLGSARQFTAIRIFYCTSIVLENEMRHECEPHDIKIRMEIAVSAIHM